MKVSLIVCDICQQHPGRIFREYEEHIFCSLGCWLDFWKLNWSHWQDHHFANTKNVTEFKSRRKA